MTRLTEQDLRNRYGLFNAGDFDAVVAQFSPEAQYRQLDGPEVTVALGREQIRGVMEGWRHFFGDNPQIEDIVIRPAHSLIREVSGAAQCFVVNFVGVGVYQNTIPGLEEAAPAHGRPVRVPIGETVWVDGDGLFVRVDNTMKIIALQ
ncbi:MAG TPA: nuclear transport factor 2 family protein [Candidatus Saccharimonadales bacterium]|nr:nuclear transport factor 2 family protein [Candidatus Saccharimonadales bacterium]